MNDEERISHIEQSLGYTFKDKSLLLTALTHSSYAHERKINKTECNERLEFLGDAVLELISSRYLFERYPQLPEGRLTYLRASLVSEKPLAECAGRMSLGELLRLGKGEEACGGRKKASVTSDAYEALIGAVYLDGGFDEAARFVEREVMSAAGEHLIDKDPKTTLQELLQRRMEAHIEYVLVNETGPDHDKCYTVEVRVNGDTCGSGSGKNKKNAEKAAAAEAVEYWKKEIQKKCT